MLQLLGCRLAPVFVLLFSVLVAQASDHQRTRPRYRQDRLIIVPRQTADSARLERLHQRSGRRLLHAYRALGDIQVVELSPGENLEQAAQQYISSGLAQFVEPDYKLHASDAPNDPEFVGGTQWALRNGASPGRDISAVEGWETLNSASNIVVAIIDSGIRYTHEDLAENVWVNPNEIPDNGVDDDNNGIIDDVHGLNAINLSGKVMDDAGHGTHVAGIIGAAGNNGIGIAGIAWKVKLMACKFLDSTGDGDTSDAIRCVDYARRNGAHIINASWGGIDYSAALYSAISNARSAGIIVVTAAGNESVDIDSAPLYPACYNLDNIVAVGGTGRADTLDTSYSNYGALNVDLCAPGSGIYSTYSSWDGAYTYLSGTSMAAPHVSGALALMKARFPAMTATQLISRLYATVDVLPALTGKCKTGGRLNLARALGSDPTPNFSASTLSGEPPLSVTFTNLTLGSLKSLHWDFGDGGASATNQEPTHVFARTGTFMVKLTVVGTNNRTNSFQQAVQVLSNYEVEAAPYAWVPPEDMAVLDLGDNGISEPLDLGFEFDFYGERHNSIYVSANGILGFNSPGLSTADNTSLPSASSPNGIICPYWDNLNPAAGGTVYAGWTGAEPSRQFVVSWVDVPRNSTATRLTFQAILREGSNDVIFQYHEVHPEASRGGAKRATVGVESGSGSVGTMYTYNGSPRIIQNQSALRFRPRGYRYLLAAPAVLNAKATTGPNAGNAAGVVTLDNPGTLDLEWNLETADPWIDLTSRNGTLRGGESQEIPILLGSAAESLAAGVHSGKINIRNLTDGAGNIVLPVELLLEVPVLEEPKSILALGSTGSILFSGGLGGPFNPSVNTVTLSNTGNRTLQWRSSVDFPWLSLNPEFGLIEPGQSEFVEVGLTSLAEDLGSGTFIAVARFENETDSGPRIDQVVELQVRSRVGQASASIIDGVFHGELIVPPANSYQVEWSEDLDNWQPLGLTPAISGNSLQFDDPVNPGSRRFYRVRLE